MQTGDQPGNCFAVPKQLIALSDAITPREYGLLRTAVEKELKTPELVRELNAGPGYGDLQWIAAKRVHLGSLGEGAMVEFAHSPSCGNGGCPMWLFVRGEHGYRSLIRAAGWGFSLIKSSAAVPDVAFYWQMGAGQTDVSQYRYKKEMFAVFNTAKCMGEDDKHGICANLSSQDDDAGSLSPAEYDSLRQHADSTLSAQFSDAHAVDIGLGSLNARIVAVGCTSRNSNCSITVYGCIVTYPNAASGNMGGEEANLPDCQYWTMLRGVRGWGVTNVSDFDSDPFAPRVALVIARHLSSNSVEFTPYSAITDATGPQPGMTLSPDKCRVVTKPAIGGSSKG